MLLALLFRQLVCGGCGHEGIEGLRMGFGVRGFKRVVVVLLATLVATLVMATSGLARPQTTAPQTILDRDGDNRLEPAPGEEYVVRDDLGQALPGREEERQEISFFGQMTDLHIVDEESPLRVEYLDRLGDPFTSAYRPQEGLSPHVLNEMARQLRNTVSPVTQRQLELVMTTGDNSDNTQLNETRWFIDVLDGAKKVDPNSGVEGTCEPPDGKLYDGVRGGDEYYEPDRSPGANAGNDNEDGPGYSPNQAENEREAQRSNAVRDFPNLFEDMNKPFRAVGLDLPWYGIFGNHDGLVQGNQPRNQALEQIATGCVKVTGLSSDNESRLRDLAEGGLTPDERMTADTILLEAVEGTARNPSPDLSAIVPQDSKRKPLKKREFIEEHFNTNGAPVGHGFTPKNVTTGQGYYSFKPKPGLRFIVLDSVAENGGSDGNIDDTQFRWIHDELRRAEENRELVMLFAHHSLETMNMAPVSPFPPGDQGGDPSPAVHFGEAPFGERAPTPCTLSEPAVDPTPDETLRCLFLRHPGVVGFIVGHEHDNRVRPGERREGAGRAAGGFWQIVTASHIDWPQQSRVIDLVDNLDGNLSIFGTIVDHNAPPNPGGAPAEKDGKGQAGKSVDRLASISRELSYNDPDANNGEDGRPDRRGGRDDRNVELLVKNPYPDADDPDGDNPGEDDGDEDDSDEE